MPLPILVGNVTGVAALSLVCLSAFMMAFRARLLKPMGGSEELRKIHVFVALLALVLLAVHIGVMFSPPVTLPLDLGYAAFALGAVLWLTGIGFLERNRDSFLLHGSLAVALLALILVHAASSGVNFPAYVSVPTLLAAGSIALVSSAYNFQKLRPRRR